MLNELDEMQSSDESVLGVEISFDVETRTEDGDEIVEKEYSFAYAKEWDKWTFVEYIEKRANNSTKVDERNWRKARHLFWYDLDEVPSIDVPPEVSQALSDATSDEVILQEP